MAVALVVVAVSIFGFVNVSKTRELTALKEYGQICVYNSDESIEFGCADYPQIKFGICSNYEIVSWWAWLSEYTSLTEDFSRSQGQRDIYSCNDSKFPYLYTIDFKGDDSLRLGKHIVDGSPYSSLVDGTYLDGGHNLIAKVTLKQKGE
jgi:hypothetical protein